MNLNEINFSFGGQHCLRDFGCIYVEKGGHPIAPPVTPNAYEIAGMSGTVRLPGEVYGQLPFEGTLYFLSDPPSQSAAQERLRAISRWLLNGRQRLVFDYEPDRYYLAEVVDGTDWGFSGWIEGGLEVGFFAQPYAYSVTESTASLTTTVTDNALNLSVSTGVPAPLKLVIQNTGAAAITGVTVTVDGKAAAFFGMNVAAGDSLTIDMEPPVGAIFSGGGSALPHATQFDSIELSAGKHTLGVTLAFGAGTKSAKVTASARGRWL